MEVARIKPQDAKKIKQGRPDAMESGPAWDAGYDAPGRNHGQQI